MPAEPVTTYTVLLVEALVKEVGRQTKPGEELLVHLTLSGEAAVLVGFGADTARKLLKALESL